MCSSACCRRPRRPDRASAERALRRAEQRVAIARALVTRPSVLLADEPTGNLDSGNAEEVLTLLEHVHGEGTTIVMVTHSHDVAQRASRILRVADGLLVADELLAVR